MARKRFRLNPGNLVGSAKGNLKTMFSREMLTDGAAVATGSIAAPVLSGLAQGMINSARPGMIAPKGPMSKALDLMAGAVLATVFMLSKKGGRFGRYVLLGSMSGVMTDLTSETVLPMVGLSEYLSPNDLMRMSDFLTLKPGMRDTVPPRYLRDYLQYPKGMKDWASVEQMRSARGSGGAGEEF